MYIIAPAVVLLRDVINRRHGKIGIDRSTIRTTLSYVKTLYFVYTYPHARDNKVIHGQKKILKNLHAPVCRIKYAIGK